MSTKNILDCRILICGIWCSCMRRFASAWLYSWIFVLSTAVYESHVLRPTYMYHDPHVHTWCEPHVLWNTCTIKHMSYEPHVPWTTCENEPHVLWTTWDMNIMYYGMNHMRCEPHVSYEPHEMWTSCTMNHTKSVVHSTLLKNVLCLHCTVVCDSYDSMIFNLHDPLYNEAIYLGVFVFQLITANYCFLILLSIHRSRVSIVDIVFIPARWLFMPSCLDSSQRP